MFFCDFAIKTILAHKMSCKLLLFFGRDYVEFLLFFPFMLGSIYWSDKAMAPHSSTLAWRIPWTEEPGGLQSMGLLRVGHD